MSYDGLVSRYLNRRLSRPLAGALRPTPIAPNHVTAFTLLLALATGAMLAAGWNIAGGIAIQAVSVIDGVDGELARLKQAATRLGAIFDAVSDRYADAAIIAGMTVYAARFEARPHPEVVGMLALGASLIVSYSRARIEADLPAVARSGNLDRIFGLASRDVRSLLLALGAIVGQCYLALALVAGLAALTIAWRLVYLRTLAPADRPAADG
ncbi:CDP-alcohol phosphatidyltransferase family protein [Tepidiforma sp.]|uniref:CDP-alcohol phosphatidyltransferase family protein n=1 Tax=Tepidiforma sp. TaxID=2682230 RepID=UPI002ADE0B0D|nr:CDP-alcohol phosphatidyltransferase family protein [Tepidiforma sp.]